MGHTVTGNLRLRSAMVPHIGKVTENVILYVDGSISFMVSGYPGSRKAGSWYAPERFK